MDEQFEQENTGDYEMAMADVLTKVNSAEGLEKFAPQIEKLMKEMNKGTEYPLWMQIAMPKIVKRLEYSKRSDIMNQINSIGLGLKFEQMLKKERPLGELVERETERVQQPTPEEGITPATKIEKTGRLFPKGKVTSSEMPRVKSFIEMLRPETEGVEYQKAGETIFGGRKTVEKGKPIPKMTEVAKGEGKKGKSYQDVLDFMKVNAPPEGKVWGLSSDKEGNWSLKDENKPTDPSWQMDVKPFGSYTQEIFFNPKTQEVKYGKKTSIDESPATKAAKEQKTKALAIDLSNQFARNPISQGFPIIQNQMDRLEEAAKEAQKTNSYVAVDQTLIMVFNKMLDERSVVRESEYARTPKDMTIWNRVAGQIDKYMRTGGAGLTNDERNAIYSMSKRFYERYKQNYENLISDTRQKSLLYEVDPNMVITQPKSKKELPAF